MIAAGRELAGQPGKQRTAENPHPPGLAVGRLRQQGKLAARMLDHRLQPEAHAENRQPARVKLAEQLVAAEVGRTAGAGREHDEIGPVVVKRGGPEASPQRHHVRALLAEIAGQGVHERVLVIDEEHAQAVAGELAGLRWRAGGGFPFFPFLRRRVGVEQQGRACPHRRDAVADVRGPQREPGVHPAVEADHADGSAVPAALPVLVILDELHCPGLRRAGDGDRPHVGEEGVQRVESGPQPSFHMVDGVDDSAVDLDLAPPDYPDAAGLADPGLVVAVHVGAHGQLGFLLRRIEQRADVRRVLQRSSAAGDRSGDRAGLDPVPGHSHVHLRRCAD